MIRPRLCRRAPRHRPRRHSSTRYAGFFQMGLGPVGPLADPRRGSYRVAVDEAVRPFTDDDARLVIRLVDARFTLLEADRPTVFDLGRQPQAWRDRSQSRQTASATLISATVRAPRRSRWPRPQPDPTADPFESEPVQTRRLVAARRRSASQPSPTTLASSGQARAGQAALSGLTLTSTHLASGSVTCCAAQSPRRPGAHATGADRQLSWPSRSPMLWI